MTAFHNNFEKKTYQSNAARRRIAPPYAADNETLFRHGLFNAVSHHVASHVAVVLTLCLDMTHMHPLANPPSGGHPKKTGKKNAHRGALTFFGICAGWECDTSAAGAPDVLCVEAVGGLPQSDALGRVVCPSGPEMRVLSLNTTQEK